MDYQLVYWGGCNSYSYYTLPFFDLKTEFSNGADPKGTKNLDIIANGLPSLFSLNAINAEISLRALVNYAKTGERTSYQSMIEDIEAAARQRGAVTLTSVLGDEDNAQ